MKKVVAVAGPTSSGKTDLGRKIVEKYDGVVVSVDSRQIYRGLDIGSGKDKTFHQEMIDIIAPGKSFSVAQYQKLALKKITQILKNSQLPVLVGGSGYYLDSLLYKQTYPKVINFKLKRELEKLSTQDLIDRLANLDSHSARRAQKNRRRLIRALEIVQISGQPVPAIIRQQRFNHRLIVLDPGKEKVEQNIKKRLNQRIKNGMIEEVEGLLKRVSPDWLINLGLEYQYITLYLQNKLSKQEMLSQLYTANCQYSRRQRTWLRRYREAKWVKNLPQAVAFVEKFAKGYNKLKDQNALPGRF